MYTLPDILHTFLIVIPIVFALLFFSKDKRKSNSARILGVMLVFISLYYIVTSSFIAPSSSFKLHISKNILYFLFLSITPFFYLYTISQTRDDFKFKNRFLIHYLPSLVLLIWSILVFNFISPVSNLELFEKYSSLLKATAIILYTIQLVFYTVLMIIELRRHSKRIQNNFSYENQKNNLNWLRIFLAIFMTFSVVDLSVYFFSLYKNWAIYYYLINNAYFLFIAYKGFLQPDIYIKAKELSTDLVVEPPVEDGEEIDGKKLLIPSVKSQQLFDEIKSVIQEQELFKNPELSIYDVSKILNINKTYISYVINTEANENFNSFINKYRIEESKKMLLDNKYDNYTIEAIANLVGFHSKSSFNTAFKKQIGITPSDYKKQG